MPLSLVKWELRTHVSVQTHSDRLTLDFTLDSQTNSAEGFVGLARIFKVFTFFFFLVEKT